MKLKSLDYLNISHHFTEDEIMVQHTAREFVANEVMPDIEKHFEQREREQNKGIRLGSPDRKIYQN